jgi:anti-sigma regulatory factor (Ser/Thr protein kinase)
MKTYIRNIRESIGQYRFEIRHLAVLFIILSLFQFILSFVHKISLQKILVSTQEWYQRDSAERLANLTTTSIELLLESRSKNENLKPHEVNKIIQDLNIILSQQYLQQNVQELCLLVPLDSSVAAIDDGHVLYSYIFEDMKKLPPSSWDHSESIARYVSIESEFRAKEQIHTVVDNDQTFHIFVPFVPRGELAGAVYMRNTPDFSVITNEMISAYDETSITYSALILFGLLAMFYISSYTLKERNKAQELLFDEQKRHLADQINTANELLFTKRIYHTHHKAEKIMGFIKDDIRLMTPANIDTVKLRINKYANFIARVIYDMKWYDPPVQTIRSQIFNTNINDVLTFLIDYVFKRISLASDAVVFHLELDPHLPTVHINEFVTWEVFEPIIQNCIDHAGNNSIIVTIRTAYDSDLRQTAVKIMDNGTGIEPWLLEEDAQGRKRIFHEHTSTKKVGGNRHAGYGCYIAYEIAKQRCGWDLTAENLPEKGSSFTITIPHQ